jgi:sensor domain CHASE-containing protein
MKKFSMSLQARILVIVLAVVGLYAAIDYASQRFFVLPGFISLEQSEAQNTMRRCVGAVKREISSLAKSAREWAASQDTYQFVDDRNDGYIRTHLGAGSFIKNNLNLIHISDATGRTVWGQMRDLQSGAVIQLDDSSAGFLTRAPRLFVHESAESSTAGICTTEHGPILTASCPVTKGKDAGPSRGTLVVGKFLNDILLNTLADQTSAEFRVWMVADRSMPASEREVLTRIQPDSPWHIREVSSDCLSIYTILPDVEGAAALLMRVDLPRDIKSKAIAGFIRSNLLSNLMAGLIVLLVLWILLRNAVVEPISKLTGHVTAIGRSDNFSERLMLDRTDEIGTLAREFDRMVEQLADSRRRLSEQCYNLGKAEVASGVLHNARNVLTPLVSRIGSLREKLHEVPTQTIETAQAELDRQDICAERKQNLEQFVNLSCRNLVSFFRATKDKLDEVAELVAQIEEMLAEQGKFSHAKLPVEQATLSSLLRDSIALLPRELSETISIEVKPSVEAIAPMMVHSITLLQVFNNVLLNAAESIQRAGRSQGTICIRAGTQEFEGVDMIDVQIVDNGEGIEPASMHRIFERGFSTKHNIPSGIGLHWCANAVAMMNGQIYAESEGSGRGTCFHILLPVSQSTRCLSHEEAEAIS